MLIKDNSNTYDSEAMLLIAKKEPSERTSIERDEFNYFCRLVYLRYVNVRSVVSHSKCQKLKPNQVRDQLKPEQVRKYYSFSDDEIHFYIDFAEKYIQIVA